MIYRCFINALSSIDLAFSSYRRLLGGRLGRSVVSRLLGAGGNSDGNAYRRRMSDQSNPLGPPRPWEFPTGALLVGMPIEARSKATSAQVITPSTPMTGPIRSQASRGYSMGPPIGPGGKAILWSGRPRSRKCMVACMDRMQGTRVTRSMPPKERSSSVEHLQAST